MDWRRSKIAIIVSFLITLFIANGLAAKDDNFSIDKDSWEQKKDKYNYGDIKPKKKKKEDKSENEPYVPETFEDPWWSVNAELIKIISIAVIIIVISVIIFRLLLKGNFKTDGKVRMVSTDFSIEEIEENLEESDLDAALRICLENNDYKTAIRIYYLSIIKSLSELELIQWKKDKTNYQYILELSKHKTGYDFAQLTINFERVWYGDQKVNEKVYQTLSPQFLDYLKRIENEKQ